MVFISLAKDIPMIMSEITALFKTNQLSVVRAQIEPLSEDGAKHTYFLKSIRTHTKLTEFEVERIRGDLAALIDRHQNGPIDSASGFGGSDVGRDERIKILEETIAKEQNTNQKIQEQIQNQSERFEKFLEMHEQMVRATSCMPNGGTPYAMNMKL